MTNTPTIELVALKVDQPIGDFYIGAISYKKLLSISTNDVRMFLNDNADSIAGIQRPLSMTRVNKISEYVNFEYASFPTSIILALDERCVTLEESKDVAGFFKLKISEFISDPKDPDSDDVPLDKAAFIIDGQHRLAGLEIGEPNKDFELNVSIFVGIDAPDKAEMFSSVNLTQTKVNRSLVYDLYEFQKKPSPFKTAHKVTIALDRDKTGPFYGKIKRLGVATPGREKKSESFSQATIVKGILRHMPAKPDLEKNKGFLGLRKDSEPSDNWTFRIFTPFYRKAEEEKVLQIMTNYFTAVSLRWPSAWEDTSGNYMLSTTNGYNALVRFLRDAYLHIVGRNLEPRVVTAEEFREFFNKIELPLTKLTKENYLPGSSGSSSLYNDLVKLSGV